MNNKVTLATVGRRKAEYVFQRELKKVLENISDPATDQTKKRTVVLTVEFEPDKDNVPGQSFHINTSVSGKSTLAPYKAVKDTVYLGEGPEGEAEAFLTDPKEAKALNEALEAQQKMGVA